MGNQKISMKEKLNSEDFFKFYIHYLKSLPEKELIDEVEELEKYCSSNK